MKIGTSDITVEQVTSYANMFGINIVDIDIEELTESIAGAFAEAERLRTVDIIGQEPFLVFPIERE